MAKLWEKSHHISNKEVEIFLTKDDIMLDNDLVLFDVYASLAHAYMLKKIGLLDSDEFKKIKTSLLEIVTLHDAGKFTLTEGDEDIHTKIENYLTHTLGQTGKKIHTGRSRNDQVLVALRLYNKSALLVIWELTHQLTSLFIEKAELFKDVPMPGYTHMQKGMPSSVGMWLGSYAEALLDHLTLIETAYDLTNQSPLGAGASYGVPLPLDREITCSLLGFAKVQNNSLYTQNSRGKIEANIMFACMQVVSEISKFASDLLLFSTSEFNLFTVDQKFTTGSSIMPQKKNYDVAEVLRAKVHIMYGYFTQVYSTVLNLPSGYNRDFQETKKPFMEGINLTKEALTVCSMLLETLTPNHEALENSMTKELYATEAAYELVKKGVPFREAYKTIGESLDSFEVPDKSKTLTKANHVGATGNLQLNMIKKELKAQQLKLQEEQAFAATVTKKLKGI